MGARDTTGISAFLIYINSDIEYMVELSYKLKGCWFKP
jgi:hypothetical protein